VVAEGGSGLVASFAAEFPRAKDGAATLRLEHETAPGGGLPDGTVTPGGPILGGAFTPDGRHLYLLEGSEGRALVVDPGTLRPRLGIPGAGGGEIVWVEVPRSAVERLRTAGPALRAASRNILRSIFLRQRGYRDLVITEEVTDYGRDGTLLGQYETVRRVKEGGLVREDSERGSTLRRWGRLVRTTREDAVLPGDWLADLVYLWRTVPLDEAITALAGDVVRAGDRERDFGSGLDSGSGLVPGGTAPGVGVAIDILHRRGPEAHPVHAVGAAPGDTLSTQIEVDEGTGFPLRIIVRRPFDPARYVTRFDEYRVIDGHWIPARVTDSIDGVPVRRRSLRSTEYDSGITDALLLAP
jgi:hypothetical protein